VEAFLLLLTKPTKTPAQPLPEEEVVVHHIYLPIIIRRSLVQRDDYGEGQMTEDEFKKLVDNMACASKQGQVDVAKASIISAFAELRKERDLLREAVEAVEFVYHFSDDYGCPWCFVTCGPREVNDMGHQPDCLRQRALAVKEDK